MTGVDSILTRHVESNGYVSATVDQVFSRLDDHSRLTSHMSKPSWKLGWGRMQTELDEGQGRMIGSRIRVAGRVFGIAVSVEEIVTERIPSRLKIWETTSVPKLLVLGHYRMGFKLSPRETGCTLCDFIEYPLPEKVPDRWLGYLFSQYCAKWCTRQMVDDAVKHFEATV